MAKNWAKIKHFIDAYSRSNDIIIIVQTRRLIKPLNIVWIIVW